MRPIGREWCALGVVAAVWLIAPRGDAQGQPAPVSSPDLAGLYAPGRLLQDRNGDGVIDFVNAHVVLGERPSAADVSGAADLAARLGFETMAMNLPLSLTPEAGATALIVGRDGMRRAGVTTPARMASLRPGEGMIAVTAPAVIVAGADAAGTMAAAELLAGRLPHVWDLEGPSLSDVASDVRTVLVGGGTDVGSVTIPAVTVRAGADEIQAIDVTVTMPTADSSASAARTLRRLIASPSTRPAGALSYPGAAMIRIEIAAPGARPAVIEVSSTSHTLKLAEMLLTDPAFKDALMKVNVVFHPFTNPDGAQLAYDLYQITPDYMLHPGYLGPLGVSLVTRWDSDPIYPESKVRVKLWKTWLPDIFLNPHGYPSHEWVQIFSEYAAWVRNRVTEARDWQQMRGWFIPGFNYLDDPKYPRYKEAAFKIREMITNNINAVPEVRALNQRSYERYRRYGFQFDDENFKMDFTNGVLIYTDIKGDRADTSTRSNVDDDFMIRQPDITIWYGLTEAPDETAYGDWMKLVATMGLQWDKALLQYLVDGKHVVERKGSSFFGGAALRLDRPRPPKPEPEPSPQSP